MITLITKQYILVCREHTNGYCPVIPRTLVDITDRSDIVLYEQTLINYVSCDSS